MEYRAGTDSDLLAALGPLAGIDIKRARSLSPRVSYLVHMPVNRHDQPCDVLAFLDEQRPVFIR